MIKDDIDRRILSALQADARQSTTTLAAKLGLARSTAQERIARLERTGVIAGYTAVLGGGPEGERVQALIMLSLKQQETRRILDKLAGFEEVSLCLAINGEFDLFVSADAPRLDDLDALIDAIAQIPGVMRTQTSIVLSRKLDRRRRADEDGA